MEETDSYGTPADMTPIPEGNKLILSDYSDILPLFFIVTA
jgi:hypothetical protein